jgi:hypothetical protein
MLTVTDITSSRDALDTLATIPRSEITILWHSGYWDGPIDGMLSYQSQKYWFMRCADALPYVVDSEGEVDDCWYDRYLIVVIGQQDIETEEWWHALFRKYVGHHTDYQDGRRDHDTVHPKDGWHAFYNAYEHREPRDYAARKVIGWTT